MTPNTLRNSALPLSTSSIGISTLSPTLAGLNRFAVEDSMFSAWLTCFSCAPARWFYISSFLVQSWQINKEFSPWIFMTEQGLAAWQNLEHWLHMVEPSYCRSHTCAPNYDFHGVVDSWQQIDFVFIRWPRSIFIIRICIFFIGIVDVQRCC